MDQLQESPTRSVSSPSPYAGLHESRERVLQRAREKSPGGGPKRWISPSISQIEGCKSNTPLINSTVEGVKSLACQEFKWVSNTQRASVKKSSASSGRYSPEDYFGKLRVDRLKLAARLPKELISPVGKEWLQRKRRARSGEEVYVETHDDTGLLVHPGSPGAEMKKLLARGDGVTLAALKNAPKVTDLSIAFGAARCWHNGLDDLVQWARDFLSLYSLEPDETLVTRLDLAVDVGTAFCRADEASVEGRCAKDFASYTRDGKYTGFHIRRSGKRPLTLRVYDKRERADENDARSHWEAVWEEYSVPDDSPVWRVEYEAQRDRLRQRGIGSWDDLGDEAVEAFWTYCTDEYARLEDVEGETLEVWERVQSASTEASVDRAEVEEVFDPDSLRAQALGCLRASADGQGISLEEELLSALDGAEEVSDAFVSRLRDEAIASSGR